MSLDNRLLVSMMDILKEKNDQDIMNEMFRKIAEESSFLVPSFFSIPPIVNHQGALSIRKGTDISFPSVMHTSGQYYPVFTDMEELYKMYPDIKDLTILTLTIDDYVDILEKNPNHLGIIINPYHQCLLISKDMIHHLIDVRGTKRHTIFQEM